MQTTTIQPETHQHWLDLRKRDITSTEVSALFGASPYMTRYQLWMLKAGRIEDDFEANERMIWGNRLEGAIANGVAEDNQWVIRPFKEYVALDGKRIGASFDYRIMEPQDAILEIKTVDPMQLKESWILDEDYIEAPPHIELQLQHQMLVSGVPTAFIAALVGGNRIYMVHRKADPDVHDAIMREVEAFWKSIDDNEPPEPDFDRDADVVKMVYATSEAGKTVDMTGDEYLASLCRKYKEAGEAEKQAAKQKDALSAEIRTLITDAERVILDGYSISAKVVAGGTVSYERKPYRGLRITEKKVKS